jgi:metal-responsive CopG/Arc/MetJ family transcriptional regulator
MAGTKISVSLDQPLAKEIRREARTAHRKVSTWIADVVREHLRQKEAKAILDDAVAARGPVPKELRDEVRRQWPPKD